MILVVTSPNAPYAVRITQFTMRGNLLVFTKLDDIQDTHMLSTGDRWHIFGPDNHVLLHGSVDKAPVEMYTSEEANNLVTADTKWK